MKYRIKNNYAYGYQLTQEGEWQLRETIAPSRIPAKLTDISASIVGEYMTTHLAPALELRAYKRSQKGYNLWEPSEVEYLTEMYQANRPLTEIAADLGRSASSVYAKLDEIGVYRSRYEKISVSEWSDYIQIALGHRTIDQCKNIAKRSNKSNTVAISRARTCYRDYRRDFIKALLGEISFTELRDKLDRVPAKLYRATLDTIRKEMAI